MGTTGFKDTIDWYDNNAKQYSDALLTSTPIESIEWFWGYLPKTPKILEVGCAGGRESAVFLDKGADVTGVDISRGLLEIARKNNPKAKYIEANFLNVPINDKTFDAVWSHASLVHLETLEDVKKALQEFNRVLKHDGILYLSVKEQMDENETAVVSDKLSNHERFFRYYKKEGFVTLQENAGFEVLEVRLQEDQHGREEVKWIESVSRKK